MENRYSIENEKLCYDGKPVPLIFGDLDQIKVIREHEEMMRKLNFEGLEIDPEFEIKFRFKCVCGRRLSFDEDVTHDCLDEYESHNTCTCGNCTREYSFKADGYGEYVVKLIGFNNYN